MPDVSRGSDALMKAEGESPGQPTSLRNTETWTSVKDLGLCSQGFGYRRTLTASGASTIYIKHWFQICAVFLTCRAATRSCLQHTSHSEA